MRRVIAMILAGGPGDLICRVFDRTVRLLLKGLGSLVLAARPQLTET